VRDERQRESLQRRSGQRSQPGVFSGMAPVNGISSLALVLSGGGSPLSKVQGNSFCVSCLDLSYICKNKGFVQCWYVYQARTN
jgi:hypothetical protein